MAAAAGSPALLSARGLTKSYGRAVAVAGVDLDIEERVFTTLLGPSGCGKTTILRMIAGFEKPSSGSLTLDGRPLDGVPPERRPVNTVFQSYALFPHLSVADNVAFSLRLRSGALDVEGKVQRALDAVHMGAFADRFPHELSGGQQQRVAVARAIVAEPQILLLDEPLSRPRPQDARRTCRSSSRTCSAGSASPSSTSPTTRKRPSRCPTASSS